MCHCITGHQQFETIQARQQMRFDIVAPDTLLSNKPFMYVFDYFGQKGSGSGGRVEYLYFVYLYTTPPFGHPSIGGEFTSSCGYSSRGGEIRSRNFDLTGIG